MLILHFSLTPLAGAPIRICKALSLHVGVVSRFAVLSSQTGSYKKYGFEEDLSWERDKSEIINLAERCDVIHLYNFIDLDSKEFAPISFRRFWDAGKPMVRQFESVPFLIAKIMKIPISTIYECPIPKLVIPQYPERYFPKAKIVPNIVFGRSEDNQPQRDEAFIKIGYSPTWFVSARESRWDTKGYPETKKILKHIHNICRREGIKAEVDLIEQVSHAECMRRKSLCDIAIDDLVTGSYHLNTLESLMMGSASLTYMDGRVIRVLQELTGRSDFPAINVGLEDAEAVLLELIKNLDLTRELGRRSRQWMTEHWDPYNMAKHYIDAYRQVINDPRKPFPERFSGINAVDHWCIVDFYDNIWRQRQKRWPRVAPKWYLKIRGMIGKILRLLHLRK
jgi:hypothetical protein